jgi:hypothetical protein
MDQDIKKQIKEIIGDIQCPREFCCLETGFDRSCKTKDVGLEGHLCTFVPVLLVSIFARNWGSDLQH